VAVNGKSRDRKQLIEGVCLRAVNGRLTGLRGVAFFAMLSMSLAIAPGLLAQASENVDNLSIEQLLNVKILTASKFSQSASDAPSAVTVIPRDEIQKYGYRTLADLLQTVRGFYITYDRNYSYLGVRGFQRPGDYNSRILILIDGRRVNDNIYAQGYLGTEFPVDLDMVDRVEIIRGPSSSLYGTSAFFGVINVITRKPTDLNGAEVSFEPGSFGAYKGRASYGGEYKGVGMALSSSFYAASGRDLFFPEFNNPASNYGIAHDGDGDSYQDLLATFTFRGFTLQGLFSSRDKSIPTGSYGDLFDARPGSGTLDSHRFIKFEYEHVLRAWDVTATSSIDRHVYDGTYISAPADPSTTMNLVNKDLGWGTWWTGEIKLQRKVARNQITLGSEFQDNLQADQLNYDVDPYLLAVNNSPQAWADWSVYGQDEIAITSKLSLNAGVRHDHYYTFGGTTNPRAGLIYHAFNPTTVKILYGTAFQAPTPYEEFYNSGVYRANLSLKPEKMKTMEAVVEQRLGKNWMITGDLFHNDLDRLITQTPGPDGTLSFTNFQNVAGTGFETELDAKLAAGIELGASYAYAPGKDEDTHQELTNSAHNLSKLKIAVPVYRNRMSIGLDAQYTGPRHTVAGSSAAGYPMFNLTLLSRNVSRHMDLSASCYNLLDRKYWDPALPDYPMDKIQQDGRSFRVKLTWHSNADSH